MLLGIVRYFCFYRLPFQGPTLSSSPLLVPHVADARLPASFFLGMHLVERLVLYPALRVRSWRVQREVAQKDVRDIMLTIRRLSITNVILFTTGDVARTIMDEVSAVNFLNALIHAAFQVAGF